MSYSNSSSGVSKCLILDAVERIWSSKTKQRGGLDGRPVIRGRDQSLFAHLGEARASVVTPMGDDGARELLERLSSGNAAAAWSEFLAQYSRVIMRVIRRQGVADDRATDCFVHVCGALSDDGFRRLLRFQPDGPARFKTWLMAVVSNLCVDWCRTERGRVRPPRSIARLTELDQQVYHCIYVRRMSRAQCAAALAQRFTDLTETTVSGINARLFSLLTPRQRWQLSLRPLALEPSKLDDSPDEEDPVSQVVDSGPGPDDLAAESQEQWHLEEALARLSVEQRLLLRLRYEQNLTLADIARLTNQPNPFRVNHRIQSALRRLADALADLRAQPDRKLR